MRGLLTKQRLSRPAAIALEFYLIMETVESVKEFRDRLRMVLLPKPEISRQRLREVFPEIFPSTDNGENTFRPTTPDSASKALASMLSGSGEGTFSVVQDGMWV